MTQVASSDCAVAMRDVSKCYGPVRALSDVSLGIRENEFFTLLGPSGCGKTTLLRLIAGFEGLDAGEIFLRGKAIKDEPPRARPINTVFQNYALFPHMTARENVMFGLRMLKWRHADAEKRVANMLELTRLSDFADRMPAQLSGGQQQRIAVARALAPQPEVLLLDEALSALDLKLRQAMRLELKRMQRETGVTFIFVTHDQDEALTMSDRLAVMSEGRVRQVGAPREIYDAPADCFVAGFIGETNLLRGQARATESGQAELTMPGGHALPFALPEGVSAGDIVAVSIRPEKLRFVAEEEAASLQGVVADNVYVGAMTQTHVRLRDGPTLVVCAVGDNAPGIGEAARLRAEEGAARALYSE